MPELHSLILYTFTRADGTDEDRWASTGIPDSFFEDAETARLSVLDIRREVLRDTRDEWSPIHIEKIETVPVTKDAILALLNDGIETFIKSHEIVETIS